MTQQHDPTGAFLDAGTAVEIVRHTALNVDAVPAMDPTTRTVTRSGPLSPWLGAIGWAAY